MGGRSQDHGGQAGACRFLRLRSLELGRGYPIAFQVQLLITGLMLEAKPEGRTLAAWEKSAAQELAWPVPPQG